VESDFGKAREFRAELFPKPLADDFKSRVFEPGCVVEGGVIEFF
jgi:hypothetical protein